MVYLHIAMSEFSHYTGETILEPPFSCFYDGDTLDSCGLLLLLKVEL